jgi:EAL and modified HD-GYP domain-containing signal transduction protein
MTENNRPDNETQQRIDDKPNKRVVTDLIERAKQSAAPAELGAIIRTDPILCYALLAEFGSSGAVPREYVTSCRQAIDLMGLPLLIEWLEAALEHAVDVPKFSRRVRDTLIRARFMELMGRSTMKREDTEDLYLVGLFSQLDKLVDMSLPELILPLPFSEDVRSAILEQLGRIGRLLKFAQTIESADEAGIDFMQTNMHLPSIQVYDAYNEAYDWMKETEEKLTANA